MKDATVLPDRNADSVTSDGATKDGRGALEDYLSLKYITRNNSVSSFRIQVLPFQEQIYLFLAYTTKTSGAAGFKACCDHLLAQSLPF